MAEPAGDIWALPWMRRGTCPTPTSSAGRARWVAAEGLCMGGSAVCRSPVAALYVLSIAD